MTDRTRNNSGLIGVNRYSISGLEDAFAVGVLIFAAAATSGVAEADPYTGSFGGMIGSYRSVSAVSVDSEASGTGSLAFSAAAVSNDVVDRTAPWGGMIGPYRSVSDTPTTGWSYTLSAILSATVEEITDWEINPVSEAQISGVVSFDVQQTSAGAGTLAFTAAGKSGAIATAGITFTPQAFIVGTGLPVSYGAGEAEISFVSDAVGSPEWPIVITANLAFSATADSQAEKQATATATLDFTPYGVAFQDYAGSGEGFLTFTADGNSGASEQMAGEAFLSFSADGRGPDSASTITITDVSYSISIADVSYRIVIT